MTSDLDKAKQKVLEENTAQAVFKTLRRLENERERFRTRWAWELLQNARDSAKNEGVEVAFLVQEGQLIFRHSGKPFTENNIVHLIYHGSSKVNENDPVGHFGTGFISTHLISKMVRVRGSLDGTDGFNFTLDRRGESPQHLQSSMEKSWVAFKESMGHGDTSIEDGYSTEYVYEIGGEKIKEMVDEGLEELRHNAGFILAFNDGLRALHLDSDTGKTIFHKIGTLNKDKYCKYTQIEERGDNGSVVDVIEIGMVSDGEVMAAVSLGKDLKGRVITLAGEIPRLYVAFPLLGTEEFCLPCVINSTRFEPTEDRDGIYLARGETKDNTVNRALLERGIKHASSLLEAAANEGWSAGYRLAALSSITPASWLDKDWYKDVLTTAYLPVIRSSVIVPTRSGRRISPLDSWIPIGHGAVMPGTVWNLANKLKEGADRLPIEGEADYWSANLSGWAALLEQETAGLDEAFGLVRLAKHIAGFSDINQLTNAIDEGLDAFQWLKNLYRTLFEANQTDLFDEYAILPNQTGSFRLRKHLKLDQLSQEQTGEPIDSILKEISEGFGDAVCNRLLDRRIDEDGVKGLLQPLYQEELVTELADRVREHGGGGSLSKDAIIANVGLFAWVLRHQAWKVIEGYPVITRGSTDGLQSWQTLSLSGGKRENRLLAPVALWPEIARDYVDLFPDRFIIAEAYYESCPEAESWGRLISRGYIFAGPLFKAEQRIKDFLPDEPLPETSDKESMRSSESVEVSKIAFLTTDDIGILHTVRNSRRKAVRFLEFLLYAVLEIDQSALDKAEVKCENGETHTYFKADWLGPIKGRKWIPIGEGKQDYISPVSLSLLIKDSRDLMAALTEGRPALLMHALSVSISALSLHTLADEEDDRVSLIRSLAKISEAAGGNIEKIEELARELNEDPELLAKIEQSRENRKQVEVNRLVGALVEEIFKEMLEVKGFVVRRTGIGSDYSVESDVIDGGEESGLSIQGHGRQFLIEIKSTTGDAVRMSVTQMSTAVENTDNFVVCFVRLSELPPDIESVKNECRFIFDIGRKVEGMWHDLSDLREIKAQCTTQPETGDMKLEIDELGAHLKIEKEAWDSGKTLDEAVSIFSRIE